MWNPMIPAVYTIDDVAKRLGMTKRSLEPFLRATPRDQYGEALYSKAGRTKLFTEDDIRRLLMAMKWPVGRKLVGQEILDAHNLLPSASGGGTVYFIEAGDFIKIGYSKS